METVKENKKKKGSKEMEVANPIYDSVFFC
jgi:hypothetical protein